MKSYAIALFAIVLGASTAQAATLQVGPARTYTNLNAALAVAGSGDVIEMDEDVTFTQCSVLPNKGNLASPIRIRSSASNANLPGTGVRFDPGNVTSGATWQAAVAILQACTGGASAITAALGAQDYIIGPGLKFLSNPGGFNAVITLGSNSTGQDLESEQPQDIVFDRNWISGDLVFGQKVGVDMGGKNISVTNNYIENIAAVGQDAIGVRNVNGYGPYLIENNFIEAAAENFISGGDSPQTRTTATVTTATVNSATLASLSGGHAISELRVGQNISFLAGTNTKRVHSYVRSCGTSTSGAQCSSLSITFDPVDTAPDTGTGSSATWGAIADGFTIRRNHFYKDPAWRDPILGQPVVDPPTPSTASGSLPAGTYYYRVVARNPNGYGNDPIYGLASLEVQCVLTATGQCGLAWPAITNATHYRVFRGTATGAQTGYFEVTTNSATDTGLTLTASSLPSSSKWVVKNLFEIKFGTNWVIEFNEFENSWPGADNGQAIWFKANDYGGVASFAQTKNVLFQNNRIDKVPGCFNILGRNENGNKAPRPMENLTIRNVVCQNSSSAYLDKVSDTGIYAINVNEPINGFTLENSTFDHRMRGFMYLIATSGPPVTGLAIRNVIFTAESNGIFASGVTCTKGTSCLQAMSPGYVFAGNVAAGASSSGYPTGNTYPTVAEYTGTTNFTDYANDDFTLKVTSPWKGQGVGGVDPGANIALLTSGLTGVKSGAAPSTTPLDITTSATLTTITQGAACSTLSSSLATTGGTGTVTWAKTAGNYPAGCTISSGGAWSGTTTTPGSGTFTMRATDSTSGTPLTDQQQFSWVINPTSSTLAVVTSGTLDALEIAVPYSKQLECSGGTAPYKWDVSSGTVPTYATLDPTGLYSAIPDSTSAVSFTARCTDAVGATATRAFTQTVSLEAMSCSRGRTPAVNNVKLEGGFFRRPTPPSSSAPDCAMKGDLWLDTKNIRLMVATVTNPLTWSSATNTLTDDPVGTVVTVDGAPEPGDIPVGTEDGRYRRLPSSQLTGLDASAIATGTISAARLPPTGWAIVPFHVPATASATWTDQPSAETELLATASKRMVLDTRGMTQVQIHFRVQGASGSANTPRCYAKYSLDDSTFTAITGGDVSLAVSGTKTGAWATVPTAAQTETTVWSVFCIGGDGAADPAVGAVALQFK